MSRKTFPDRKDKVFEMDGLDFFFFFPPIYRKRKNACGSGLLVTLERSGEYLYLIQIKYKILGFHTLVFYFMERTIRDD